MGIVMPFLSKFNKTKKKAFVEANVKKSTGLIAVGLREYRLAPNLTFKAFLMQVESDISLS